MSKLEPKDLNFETIQQIFKDCIPVGNQTKNITAVSLQQISGGFPKDSDPVYFDTDKLEENKQNIQYLLGQLYAIHRGDVLLHMSDILKKYNGYLWSKDKIASIFILHLGMGIGQFSGPSAENLSCLIFEKIEPTLSPKDPNFEEWYKGYKQKILKKSGGQEPADD